MQTSCTHAVGRKAGSRSPSTSTLIASAISFSGNSLTSAGLQTIDWTYDPDAADLDWLRRGPYLTYTATNPRRCRKGRLQNLVITISGTNDVPTIDSAFYIDEIAGDKTRSKHSCHHWHHPSPTRTSDSLSLSVTGMQRHLHAVGRRAIPNDPAVNVSALIASGAISFSDNSLLNRWSTNHRLDLRLDAAISIGSGGHPHTHLHHPNQRRCRRSSQNLVITSAAQMTCQRSIAPLTQPPSTKSPVTAPQNIPATTAPSPSPTRTSNSLSLFCTGNANALTRSGGGGRF